MRKKNKFLVLGFVLFTIIPAIAHPGHRPEPHIHITEYISIPIITILSAILAISVVLLVKKYKPFKNKKNVS